MAPVTLSNNNSLSFATSNGTLILVQGPDNSWSLDLNTLVTIIFGIITITFQVAQVYHRQGQKKRTVEHNEDDIEHNGQRLLSRRHEAQLTPWRPPYSWDELEEYQSPEAAHEQFAPAMSTRSRAQQQLVRRDGSVQLGELTHLRPGYAYRRTPWQSEEWIGAPNSRPSPNRSALDRHYAQRRQQSGLL